jgi:hypothetical protein
VNYLLRAVLYRVQAVGKITRKRGPGKLGHALDLPHVRHRHDPRDDRDVAAICRHAVDQAHIVHRVEEELRHREVGAGSSLAGEILRVSVAVR